MNSTHLLAMQHRLSFHYISYRVTSLNLTSPGRTHDSSIFEASNLRKFHAEHHLFKQTRKFNNVDVPILLLGDGAYKLCSFLMKPYAFTQNNSAEKRKFNYFLSRTRRVIENVFGQVFSRWRILSKSTWCIVNIVIL